MSFVVKATFGRGRSRRRITSKKFKNRSVAQKFADATNESRPGSNARVTDI